MTLKATDWGFGLVCLLRVAI